VKTWTPTPTSLSLLNSMPLSSGHEAQYNSSVMLLCNLFRIPFWSIKSKYGSNCVRIQHYYRSQVGLEFEVSQHDGGSIAALQKRVALHAAISHLPFLAIFTRLVRFTKPLPRNVIFSFWLGLRKRNFVKGKGAAWLQASRKLCMHSRCDGSALSWQAKCKSRPARKDRSTELFVQMVGEQGRELDPRKSEKIGTGRSLRLCQASRMPKP
jgi:hypothetical protein